jgi:hypothetical protein
VSSKCVYALPLDNKDVTSRNPRHCLLQCTAQKGLGHCMLRGCFISRKWDALSLAVSAGRDAADGVRMSVDVVDDRRTYSRD